MTDTTPNNFMNQRRTELATAVATVYDLQKLRVMTGNRLCANFRSKLGLEPSQSEEDLEKQVKGVLDRLRQDYQKVTDGVVSITKPDGSLAVPRISSFKPGDLITTYGEFMLFQQYLSLEAQEQDHFTKTLPSLLKGIPVYDLYLDHVKGVGPAMAAILLRYFDIHRAAYPSSFWAYAGLDVVVEQPKEPGGEVVTRGRSKYKEHLVPRIYKNREGQEVETVGISFNPFLKTKLVGVLGGSFLKCKSPYADVYYNYRHRLENHPRWGQDNKEANKARRHAMAMRYMVKIFLADFHTAWREIEGLPYIPTYEEAKLGHVHGGGERRQRVTNVVWPQKKAA